jgi:phage-related tail protein
MDSIMKLGIILTVTDKLSGALKSTTANVESRLGRVREAAKRASGALAAIGTASYVAGRQTLEALQKPIAAFSEYEDAATQLRLTLMKSDGAVAGLKAIEEQALRLGNRLPGSTADFLRMASSLKALGVSETAISRGVLEAAANLGVVLKPLGVTFDQAAESAAKFGDALGISEKDMLPFMDTIQRLAHMGVDLQEMRYAFSKASPALKSFGAQGLATANELAPLVGMLIKTGKSGEEVGSALNDIINIAVGQGRFTSITNLVAQLGTLQKLSPAARQQKIQKMFGRGGAGDIAALIAKAGPEGFDAMRKTMREQADLNARVEESLKTLTNAWDALTGTVRNVLVLVGGAFAPELKALTGWLNSVTERVGRFVSENQGLVHDIALAVAALGGFLTIGGGLSVMLAGLLAVISPVTLAVGLLATAALLIYKNWEPIKQFFIDLWDGVVSAFHSAIDAITGLLDRLYQGPLGKLYNFMVNGVSRSLEFLNGVGTAKSAAPTLAPARPTLRNPASNGKVGVGGALDITIRQDGRAQVSKVQSVNPAVPINVGAGLMGAAW